MNILLNPLVMRYFGCDGIHSECPTLDMEQHRTIFCDALRAYRILQAIGEPITKGDKVLQISGGNVIETEAQMDMDDHFHSRRNFILLPPQFQPRREKEYECPLHGLDRDERLCTCTSKKPSPTSEVEAKIKEIKEIYKDVAMAAFDSGSPGIFTGFRFEEILHELVELVRKEQI